MCKGRKAPLATPGMFIHLFGSVFSTFLVVKAQGGAGGRQSRPPAYNEIRRRKDARLKRGRMPQAEKNKKRLTKSVNWTSTLLTF